MMDDGRAAALLEPNALAKLIMDTHSAVLAAKLIYSVDHQITLSLKLANSNLRDALAAVFEMRDNEVNR